MPNEINIQGEVLILNGKRYIPEDSIQAQSMAKPNTDGLPYVICRCDKAGVHAGYLKEHDGNHAKLVNTRRLWYWKAKEGISLSSVAQFGLAADVALPCELPEIWLGDVYEVIPCTEAAMNSIQKAGIREQQ
jgi:hypothetical protein